MPFIAIDQEDTDHLPVCIMRMQIHLDRGYMVMKWRDWFVKNLKPVVWRVHTSVVPKVFREHGALDYLTKYANLVEKHGVFFLGY